MKTDLRPSKELISMIDIKYLSKPLAFLVVIIISTVLVVILGIQQIEKLQVKTAEATKDQGALLKKVEVLSQVDEVIPSGMDSVNVALPNQNAVIYALSQIRTIAGRNTLLVSNIRSGGSTEAKGVSKIGLNFEVTGPQFGVYNFLDEISKALPVMVIDKVKINTDAGTSKATVNLNVFGSELPKQIPSLTSAISGLSSDEVALLNELSNYSQPSFSTLDPQEGTTREDPFN